MARPSRLGIASRLYAALALLALVSLGAVAASVTALRSHDATLQRVENAAERVRIAERVNGLVYAVVMDSRGVYLAADTARARPFAEGIRRFLGQIEADVARWRTLLPPGQRAAFGSLEASAADLVRLRTELARLGAEVSVRDADRLGNNDENRRNRQGFNAAIDGLAQATAAEVTALAGEVEGLFARLATLLVVVTLGALVLIGVLAWTIVSRGVVRPLREVTATLGRLSAGERDVPIPHAARRDEIGCLAGTAADRLDRGIDEFVARLRVA
jgi:methyl-accepting chemotaxis protein